MAYNNEFGGTDVGMELDWDSEIEKESPEFITLPEGEYEFEVISFERARFNGSEKMPACNQAKLKLQVKVPEGIATINHNLFLHSRTEGILSAFFNCIGQKKHGEKLKMDWNKVIGSKGRAKIGPRVYDGKTFNEVKRFLEPAEEAQPAGSKKFQNGKF
ncbi:MAG: DUF669 domain-containing protein [Sporomusaceae bacterium]|nr:DUF669 domain-containing protein [Sporomusaceae bacterium]